MRLPTANLDFAEMDGLAVMPKHPERLPISVAGLKNTVMFQLAPSATGAEEACGGSWPTIKKFLLRACPLIHVGDRLFDLHRDFLVNGESEQYWSYRERENLGDWRTAQELGRMPAAPKRRVRRRERFLVGSESEDEGFVAAQADGGSDAESNFVMVGV